MSESAWHDWKLQCDRIAEQRDEWRRRCEQVVAQRDRLGEALRNLVDVANEASGFPDGESVTRFNAALENAYAVLAECAGTPAEIDIEAVYTASAKAFLARTPAEGQDNDE